MAMGSDEVRVQLSDRVMKDLGGGKWVGYGYLRGGEAAGIDCGEFHQKWK